MNYFLTKNILFIFSLFFFLGGCLKSFLFSKPESCIANFQLQELDFDTDQHFQFYKSQNPKVSDLLLSENMQDLYGRNSNFLRYRFGNKNETILLDLKHGILHPPNGGIYDVISSNIFLSKNETKKETIIFHTPNQRIFTLPYSNDNEFIFQSRNLLKIRNGGLVGIINLMGKIIVPFEYDNIELGSNNSPIIAIKGQTKDLYDSNGTLLFSIIQDIANGDSINNRSKNGFVLFQKNNLWGALDKSAKQAIEPIYESMTEFEDNLAAVMKNGLWGYINETGKIIIPIEYRYASKISHGIGRIQEVVSNDCILIDSTGKEIFRYSGIEPSSSEACYFFNTRSYVDIRIGKESRKLAKLGNKNWQEIEIAQENPSIKGDYIISKNNKFGIISNDERFFIPMEYDNISYNEIKNEYLLQLKSKSAIYDADGKPVSNFLSGLVYDCNDGICLVQDEKTRKFGYTESSGKIITPAILDYGEGFSEGYAKISKGGNWEFIDRNGKTIITVNDSDFGSFSGETFWKKQHSLYGYQDIQGQWIIEPTLSHAENLKKGIAVIVKEGKFGLVGKYGKFLVPPNWDKIERLNYSDGAFKFTKDRKNGIVHFSGCDE